MLGLKECQGEFIFLESPDFNLGGLEYGVIRSIGDNKKDIKRWILKMDK